MLVRELPPLREYILVTTPNGNTFRWAGDERRAENVPKGLSYSTVMPGGNETMDCVLPRKARVDYQDLTQLSTITVMGVGGRVASEYRLEKAPRVSGDEMSVSPQAVGHQAQLNDDTEACEVYIDRSLQNWIPASRALKIVLYTALVKVQTDPSVVPDTTSGIPAVTLTTQGTGSAIAMRSEAWYDCGPGATVGSIYYDMISQGSVAADSGSISANSDDIATASSSTGDLLTGINSSASGTFIPSPTTYRFIRAAYATSQAAETDHLMMIRRLTVYGAHGLDKQGTAPNDGYLASDVIANAVGRWCPRLAFSTGSDGTIKPTAFVIPQLEFREKTTVSEIIRQADRFSLGDWAVWDGGKPNNPTFYYNERNARGNKWRARTGPSQLQETGPSTERTWNSAIVTYQDVDGTTRSVGPPGSACDATSTALVDTDPLNPANQLGISRPVPVDMGIVSTVEAATEVGRQFLVRSKELDHSGSAELIGYVTDDHGINHPASAVRAGDQIAFTDAADTSYRRVVHTSFDYDSKTNSLDIDAPPEGMDALLERLGVSLSVGTSPKFFHFQTVR